jgi:hypothetical protein
LVIFAKDFRLSFLLFIFLFYLNAILIASFDVLDSYFYDFKNAVYLFTFLAITFLILGILSKSGTIIFFWGLNLIAIQTSKKYLDENFRYKKLEKILDNIEDQSILAFIACKTNRWFIGCTALDRINDIKFLELISNEAILYEVQDIARYKLKLYVDFHLHQS